MDILNKTEPQNGAIISSCNCVSEDTFILTDGGYSEIGLFVNKPVNIWNGKEFTNVTVRYTGIQDLYNVILSNGMNLICTRGHRWFIMSIDNLNGARNIIETHTLVKGQILETYDLPVMDKLLNYNNEFNYPYDKCIFLIENIMLYSEYNEETYENIELLIPFNYSIYTKFCWFNTIVDIIGVIYITSFNETFLSLPSYNLCVLKNIQLFLTTMGMFSNILCNIFNTHYNNKMWYLIIPSKYFDYINEWAKIEMNDMDFTNIEENQHEMKENELTEQCETNFINSLNKKRFICNIPFYEKYNITEIKIESIELYERNCKTFCFTEPKLNAGLFNGILTGQSIV
jgi:hypothetical protein